MRPCREQSPHRAQEAPIRRDYPFSSVNWHKFV